MIQLSTKTNCFSVQILVSITLCIHLNGNIIVAMAAEKKSSESAAAIILWPRNTVTMTTCLPACVGYQVY